MKTENDFVNQWGTFGKTMSFYRGISVMALVLAVITTVALIVNYYQDPLVIVKECEQKDYYLAYRKKIVLKSEDVQKFATQFIRSFYGNSPNACTMTKGLWLKSKDLNKSDIEQYAGRVEVELTEKSTLAIFDLIITLKDIPLVVRKEIELQIIQGEHTVCNPFGLYVNGIKEREN